MVGRVIFIGLLLALGAAVVYFGWWHIFTSYAARQPMLTWLPIAVVVLVSQGIGLAARRRADAGDAQAGGRLAKLRVRAALLAGLAVLVVGGMETLFFRSNAILDDFTLQHAATLPQETQPRLLPRSGVRDDPRFAEAKEIHLVRDPGTGGLVWTGEWEAGTFSGPSYGVTVKRLDEVVDTSQVQRSGFDRAVSGVGPTSFKWKARLRHPFSRMQYPVIIPISATEAVAVISYIGYRGFPFRRPYLKGVLVYHQDGRIEDLSPQEAARRPELVRSGRIIPELVARKQAEALARSDDLRGRIVDGAGNRQPFLTALDPERTVWLTIINDKGRVGGVKALVMTSSSTGETSVWRPPPGVRLVSTREVINQARQLPLRWTETRCCDSDGHSYEVTLREVVEPRLAFKGGKPYFMVTVVPTSDLALGRQIEYTLLIDAQSGQKLDEFRHVEGGPSEDARLQAFFYDVPEPR